MSRPSRDVRPYAIPSRDVSLRPTLSVVRSRRQTPPIPTRRSTQADLAVLQERVPRCRSPGDDSCSCDDCSRSAARVRAVNNQLRSLQVSFQVSHLLLAEHPFIRSLPFCFTQRRRRSGSPESPNPAPQRPTMLRSVLLRNTLRRNSLTTGPTRNGERAAEDTSPNN
ncbi:hypothetical protein QAD02_005733 [Eretmocerus hayati]|uniref:Uncharacterized protein n=1 Tax=Eretmocerus hayati TaxID=131215 RepID=A0ACC2NV25_9HYME|nr:hypothetical protein QAD02_005733 [Eretmocerus hayati]